MSAKYEFISHYKNNNKYRNSFNQLAIEVFDLNFAQWYEKGYWDHNYICYSYMYKGKVIANVSMNKMSILIEGVQYKAIQIGTVMTDKNHRNEGLARDLIERIISDYEREVDFIYLYANDTVLDFYPKFGFSRIKELTYSVSASQIERESVDAYSLQPLKITNRKDLEIIERLAFERLPVSSTIDVIDNNHLLLFHLMIELDDIIYYIEEEDMIVVFEIEGTELHLYDLIFYKPIQIEAVLRRLIPNSIETIYFYFPLEADNLNIHKELLLDQDDVLFIRPLLEGLPKHLNFPLTSRA